MKDKEFESMISDFDGFMKLHGYYTVADVASFLTSTPEYVRTMKYKGKFPGAVMLGKKCYIPVEDFM